MPTVASGLGRILGAEGEGPRHSKDKHPRLPSCPSMESLSSSGSSATDDDCARQRRQSSIPMRRSNSSDIFMEAKCANCSSACFVCDKLVNPNGEMFCSGECRWSYHIRATTCRPVQRPHQYQR
eukprot:Rmarinus@m.11574